MKKALITGITGQDGSYLAEFLLQKGYQVHGIIRRSSTFSTCRIDHFYVDPHEPGARLFLHYGDLSDSSQLTNLVYDVKPDEIYHLGAQDAINKGLRRATGDIVCYICADDCYEKDCFALVADFFAGNSEVMWASGRCTIVDDRGREIRRPITRYRTFWQRRYSYNRLLVLDFIPQPAAFWRRELVDEIGFFDVDEHLAMDYEYWLRAGARYDPGFINAHLARFRIHPHSKSSTSFARQAREALAIARRYARAGGRNYIAPLQYLHYLLVLTGYSTLYFLSRPGK